MLSELALPKVSGPSGELVVWDRAPMDRCIYLQEVVSACVATVLSFPGGSVVKDSPADAGEPGSIPGWGRYTGVGNGTPLLYSCLENLMDRGPWWAPAHRLTESDTTYQLNYSITLLGA